MIVLKTKAQNLDILSNLFNKKEITIPKYFYFKKKIFLKNKNKLINKIKLFQKKNDIIIRSSAKDEDGLTKTLAGKYSSIILKKNNLNLTENAILNFLKQLKFKKDEVIVQKFINKVNCAGVIFTKDIKFNSPYYLVNYDKSGRTDLVTSGNKNETKKQLVIYKDFKFKGKFKNLINACKILEKKLNNDRLDIEFALQKKKFIFFR